MKWGRGVSRRGILSFSALALAGPELGPGSVAFPPVGETRRQAEGSDWAFSRACLTHLLRVADRTSLDSTLRTKLANG